jgi:hypothetical protein
LGFRVAAEDSSKHTRASLGVFDVLATEVD